MYSYFYNLDHPSMPFPLAQAVPRLCCDGPWLETQLKRVSPEARNPLPATDTLDNAASRRWKVSGWKISRRQSKPPDGFAQCMMRRWPLCKMHESGVWDLNKRESCRQAQAVRVRRTSAYQAQFKPSVSSSCESRLPMSMRAECTPSSFQGSCTSVDWLRITTGAPLVPRCVRASVRK